ncbi:hypothetical protein ACJIZ3_012482 [Penstemon smallii]|uniref:Uncharacterized protein n=1 Tax=Penstemon smallii TaxID=265156 RepID=A0ABD3RFR3_9LAMI
MFTKCSYVERSTPIKYIEENFLPKTRHK